MVEGDVKKCETRRKKVASGEEFENFTTLIDDTRWLFKPNASTLRRQTAKGTKLNSRRVSDVGISLVNDYASGVLSEMVTSGERWFEYYHPNPDRKQIALLDGVSKIMYDRMNESNFSSEVHRDQKSAACDGTALMYVERVNGKLNYVHVPFGNFWFVQDYRGRPDIVWVEKTTTVGALVGEFGDNVSTKVKTEYEKSPDKEVRIIHYCAPREQRDYNKSDKMNKPYMFLTYEKETDNLLEEGGTDMQKFLVYRVKRSGNEVLGRGPAIDSVCTMYAVERCAKDMQRGIRLSGVPIFGVPASLGQNGFRWIHQDDASVLVYDDTGIAGPPQTMNPDIRLEFCQKYMEWQVGQMRNLFFLDYFNPLDNRRNMTLGEAKERVSKAQQMVDQIVGPLVEERFNPLLKWTLLLLGESGEFAEYGSWMEINMMLAGSRIRYMSRLANAQKRIRLMSIAESTEMFAMLAQAIPDPAMQYGFMSMIDWQKIPNEIIDGTNAPKIMLRDPREAQAMAEQFAQSQAQQAQTENAVRMADAASKGGNAPDPGSMTSMFLGQ